MKYLIRLLPAVLCLFAACRQPTPEVTNTLSYDSSFLPAYFADTGRAQKLSAGFAVADSIFQHFATDNHLPGMAVGIVLDGRLIHTFNYGYSDIGRQIKVNAGTMFRIASMSKSVTAMAILKLRDQGKLRLDDPASKYIPAMKKQRYLSADAPEITIRHLLTHGAGFPEDNPWGDRQLADTDKDLALLLEKQISISNTANTNYEYSNLGFALLGKIITVVAGRQYQDYIRDEIFTPLGMKLSGYEYSTIPPEKLAHGYRWLNQQWNEEELLHDQPDGSWGAMGAMISSVDEFSRYMALHQQAWPASNAPDTQVIKRSSVREMHHPWRFNGMNLNYRYPDGRLCPVSTAYCYGLGWLRDCEERTVISHSGGLPGFGSYWGILPDYGIGIVCLANKTYSGVGRVTNMVLDSLVRLAGLKPRILPALRSTNSHAICICPSSRPLSVYPKESSYESSQTLPMS
ncbi:MAG: class A beta-lactamase-related serine hydrolase [Sphingobacteriales bacterium]|nr:MAG: class A beta-lactamase-related serine hydrolase [Sphingobacteriales bacterium]